MLHGHARPSSGRRLRRGLAVAAAALSAVAFTAGGASAAGIGQTTENRPSTVELGGAEYMAWAGTDPNGEVNVAKLNAGMAGVSDGPWTDGGSGTDVGTGPTLAATGKGANGTSYLVVAWVNGEGQVWVAAVNPSDTGSNYGYECETEVGVSTDTAYITSEGDDGTGDLYLAYVNADNGDHITVERLDPSQCDGRTGQITIKAGQQDTIMSDTSWNGPALIPDGYNGQDGSATLYLAWAGTNSTHSLNIARYVFGSGTIAAADKTVESSRSSNTDMGGAYDTATGENWISYCGSGTSNFVFFQHFGGHGSSSNAQYTTGARCKVTTYNGYYSGGVGTGYDYSTRAPWLTYADTSTNIQGVEE